MYVVYQILCLPSGKRYIGITKRRLVERWYGHRSFANNGSTCALSRAIRKYGEDAFRMNALVEAVDAREAGAIERGLIAQYGTLVPNGYNMTGGGDVGLGTPCLEVRARMSERAKARVRRPIPPEVREKMSRSRKAMMTPELRAAVGNFHRGKILSAETRAKISATKTGQKINYPDSRKPRD